jgi:hypothetical protein
MRLLRIIFSLCLGFHGLLFMVPSAKALPSGTVVISQLQTGGVGTGTAGQEMVELYNNNASDVDITGWCVSYSSAADGTASSVACVSPPDQVTKLLLKSHSYVTFASPDFATATGYRADGVFTYSGGISGTGGHVRLLDGAKNEIDKLAWGVSAVHPETSPASAPAGGKSLQRNSSQGVSQDSDNNAQDFAVVLTVLHTSGLYELVVDMCPNIDSIQSTVPVGMVVNEQGNCVTPPPSDVCSNISEVQVTIPPGLLSDGQGACYVDMCVNIDGLQIGVPDFYDRSDEGICVPHDECDNLPGAQYVIPEGYIRKAVHDCRLDLVPLQLTEILPNVAGSDTGREYIEIYNPSDSWVDLLPYVVKTGVNADKVYSFPVGSKIGPGKYEVFYDNMMKFTLVNTTGRVVLGTIDGTVLGDTGIYDSPDDDAAWSTFGDVWQYTNQPTPGSSNQPSLVIEAATSGAETDLASCPAGKYRNPLTNRCRNIESDASVLASCESDQYRSPDTGRCRKIVTATATQPCKDGQYRSEETNRCRNIVAATAPAPCKEGQERNPDTNRCRNAPATSVPDAAFAVQPVKDGIKTFVGWWALGGIGAVAFAYAGWEWRREIGGLIRKISFTKSSK